jgi:hypothetical protein
MRGYHEITADAWRRVRKRGARVAKMSPILLSPSATGSAAVSQ